MLNLHQMQCKFVLNITKKVILLYIPVQKTSSNQLPIIKNGAETKISKKIVRQYILGKLNLVDKSRIVNN